MILILFFDKNCKKKIVHRFCYNLLGSLAQLVRSLSCTYEDLSSSLRNHMILLSMMICTRKPRIGGEKEPWGSLANWSASLLNTLKTNDSASKDVENNPEDSA